MKIVFERRPFAYLPEISAYIQYIEEKMPHILAYDSSDLKTYNSMDFDIVWRFMGVDIKGAGHTVVHEYNSLSTGQFARFKNLVKQTLNAQPDVRVFLNDTVKCDFRFSDAVPSRCRDMGVDRSFFCKNEEPTEYDFVYSGSLSRGAPILSILEHFRITLKTAKLLVIGSVPDEIQERYGALDNIVFTGRVSYSDVPTLMKKARYGLNIMPDHYPLNIQTATKVLEYCALGLPVISNNYQWIREFEKKKKARFFYFQNNLENFTMKRLENFAFQVPSVEELEWSKVIDKSKVFELLSPCE